MSTAVSLPVDPIVQEAADAARGLASAGLPRRAELLTALADELDRATDSLSRLAHEESHLPLARLQGEIGRTSGQLRLFARVLAEGSYLDATIDTETVDTRSLRIPLGPVVVFAASNFPFAFSVLGGDTASALAAGCPVIVKAHEGHPRTSRATAALVHAVLERLDWPAGTFALVEGREAGIAALRDARVAAGAFTGSEAGGLALQAIAQGRPVPIPFYAEMGSLNPVIVSPGAAEARTAEIATGFTVSMTLGSGQFCTKPGIVWVPEGHRLAEPIRTALREAVPGRLLTDSIRDRHEQIRRTLSSAPGVEVLADGVPAQDGAVSPRVLTFRASDFVENTGTLLTECFGPTAILVTYRDEDELHRGLRLMPGGLTSTVHAEADEDAFVTAVTEQMVALSGRVVHGGWPTGVAVNWSMHHSGPHPASSTPAHTSVGARSIDRFTRPVCFQGYPDRLLPEALRDRNVLGIPRRVNGTLTTEDLPAPSAHTVPH
ncbi:aldehyde dehydrogenase (NADP(+)) [Streptomyces sp. NPDC059477]|uniref:aldehyde dehydrogenase (NADP(+)) n=1 Tax=Streptomyces sp. NPDC059477 TaxID=3346847 RepID=UPI0036AE5C2A